MSTSLSHTTNHKQIKTHQVDDQHKLHTTRELANDEDSNTDESPVQVGGGGSDRKARKKDQNRRAAYNYRRKKSEEKNRLREEEMRLVYSRVCLLGYADQIEGLILYILNTKTRKTLDGDVNIVHFICPLCQEACDNILDLRAHLRLVHRSHEHELGDCGEGGSSNNINNNNNSELQLTESCNLIDVNNINNNKLE